MGDKTINIKVKDIIELGYYLIAFIANIPLVGTLFLISYKFQENYELQVFFILLMFFIIFFYNLFIILFIHLSSIEKAILKLGERK